MSKQLPQTFSMDTVEGLLKIHKTYSAAYFTAIPLIAQQRFNVICATTTLSNPVCSSLSLVSTALFILFSNTLHSTLFAILSSIIPLQLSQYLRFLFFHNLICRPVVHSSSNSSTFQISLKKPCRTLPDISPPALMASAGILSGPAAFTVL